MRSRTCRYSIIIGRNAHLTRRLISLLLLFCIGLPLLAQQQRPAQTPKRDQEKKEVAEIDTIPLYNGTYVDVDLYGIGGKLLGSDLMSSEINVAVNLKNRFIPTIEFDMRGTGTWSEAGVHYKSKMAPFFRIGVDYNTMAKKKEKNNYLYAGLHYTFSSFKYDVSTVPADDPIQGDVIGNPSLEDGYWEGSMPFDRLGMKRSVRWLEIILGIKVRIYKNFNMGWSVHTKYKTGASTRGYGDPWCVPGCGKFKSNNMRITYPLVYRLPLQSTMTGLGTWLLAIGLAMDRFAVSIANGIILKRTRWKPMLIMAFTFSFFQTIMPFIGWMCARTSGYLIESVDHWITFAILVFLSGRVILESFKGEEYCKLFNPASPEVVLTMVITTNIDALAIGISLVFLGTQDYIKILPPISIVGFISFTISLIGLILGIQYNCGIARRPKAELWGSIILVIIGLKILIEHLFLQ